MVNLSLLLFLSNSFVDGARVLALLPDLLNGCFLVDLLGALQALLCSLLQYSSVLRLALLSHIC